MKRPMPNTTYCEAIDIVGGKIFQTLYRFLDAYVCRDQVSAISLKNQLMLVSACIINKIELRQIV